MMRSRSRWFVILYLAALCGCGSIMNEKKITSRMHRIHFGMNESQVRAILGEPEQQAMAPFDPSTLPKHLECNECPGAENCYIEKAVRCSHYKRYSNKKKASGSYNMLDVYYDANAVVCCTSFSTGTEWEIITH